MKTKRRNQTHTVPCGNYRKGNFEAKTQASFSFLAVRFYGGFDGEIVISQEEALRIGDVLVHWGKTGFLPDEVTDGSQGT